MESNHLLGEYEPPAPPGFGLVRDQRIELWSAGSDPAVLPLNESRTRATGEDRTLSARLGRPACPRRNSMGITVGVEPTLPPSQGGMLPLHYVKRAQPGNRTPTNAGLQPAWTPCRRTWPVPPQLQGCLGGFTPACPLTTPETGVPGSSDDQSASARRAGGGRVTRYCPEISRVSDERGELPHHDPVPLTGIEPALIFLRREAPILLTTTAKHQRQESNLD